MDDRNLQESDENSYVTTDLPDPEKARHDRAMRRVFYVLIFLCLIAAAFVTWEIIHLITMGA